MRGVQDAACLSMVEVMSVTHDARPALSPTP